MSGETVASASRGSAAGFTLVELIVALAISATVSLAIFALYGTTSDHLREADSMAETLDMARFTLERLRSDLRNAGAFATPDSAKDPWVKPDPESRSSATALRVTGMASYSGWQDDRSPIPSDIRSANADSTLGLETSFDGIIVIGAYDFPLSFEIGDVAPDGSSASIFETERGLRKLRINNPFNTKLGSQGFDFSQSEAYKPIQRNIGDRMMRLMDSKGYSQFVTMSQTTPSSVGTDGSITANNLTLNFAVPAYFRSGAERYGLAPPTQQSEDRSYEASFLDAFWYHVIQDPTDDKNYMLVRERLNANQLVTALAGDWSNLDPTTVRAGSSTDYVVIAERIVDFQIWFDCTVTAAEGNIEKGSWNVGWDTPDGMGSASTSGTTPTNNCLDPGDPDPGRIRVAHLRLSMRSETERTSINHDPNEPFRQAPNGNYKLPSFDIRPDNQGATRVFTTQLDFELPNFSYRNIHN